MRNSLVVILMMVLSSCRPSVEVQESNVSPARIISLAPAITQKLYLLGVGERLIADTVYCDRPEEAKGKIKIGNVTQVNIELIVSLQPDLVMASKLTRPEQVKTLENLGIRVVTCPNVGSFDEMCEEFEKIGRMVGAEERARDIVVSAKEQVSGVRNLTSELPEKRVFVQIGCKPLFTVTRDSFVNDYIEFAGGYNIAGGERSGIYSREKVVKENPEIIIITTMGMVGEEEKKVWMDYHSISAVQSGRIYVIDSYDMCSPTPIVFVDTLKKIVEILHPGVFAN